MSGVPERVGHYRVEGALGAGGMGEVFVAFDERLERRVAIKLLPEARALDADARGRMLREARAASALKHPGIVTIHEVGESDGRTYIVMELVEGETFAQLLARRGKLPPAEAVALAAQAAAAIGVAHAAGILHRDLKPANLMIDGRGQVKVLDFGLSKRLAGPVASQPPDLRVTDDDDDDEDIDPAAPTAAMLSTPAVPPTGQRAFTGEPVTAYGVRMGTPGYAALELMIGGDVDQRSDVFSLGVVLYELVTGQRPFEGKSWRGVRDVVATERYQPPSKLAPVDGRFDAALARALRADAQRRYPSVAEMLAAVTAALPGKPRARAGFLVAGGATLLVAGVAVAVGREPETPAPVPRPVARPPAGRADLALDRPVGEPGGCAEAPAFLDEDTLVYASSIDDRVDLFIRAGEAAPRPLVTGPLNDWRPAAGRPGELVFLRMDSAGSNAPGAGVFRYEVASGKETRVSDAVTPSAAADGDDVFYIRRDGTEIHRVRGPVTDVVLAMPSDAPAQQVTVAPGGARVAIVSAGHTTQNRICLGDLATRKVDCAIADRVLPGRPAFTRDGKALYYASARGIVRRELDGGDETVVVPGVRAHGGIALSPAGTKLAYSDCRPTAPILEAGAGPVRTLVDEAHARDPSVHAGGRVAFVRITDEGSVLVLREPDGRTRQLTNPTLGRISGPSFDTTGTRLTFMVAGRSSGVHVHLVDDVASPQQLSHDAADESPTFTRDGRVVFHRWDEAGRPALYVASVDGGEPLRTGRGTRFILSEATTSGEILIASGDGQRLFLWDPVNNRERPLVAKVPDTALFVSLSPDGNWLLAQSGLQGQVLLRERLGRGAVPETIWDGGPSVFCGAAAIRNDGVAVFTPRRYAGQVHEVPAHPGARF